MTNPSPFPEKGIIQVPQTKVNGLESSLLGFTGIEVIVKSW